MAEMGVPLAPTEELQGIHEGEHRRVRADADGEHAHDDCRESRVAGKRSNREAEIMAELVDQIDTSDGAFFSNGRKWSNWTDDVP